jgi:hypothetical protein
VTAAKIWRIYQRWRRYLANPEPPCCVCKHLSYDRDAVYGVRCAKGNTSGQVGDFSCFEQAK